MIELWEVIQHGDIRDDFAWETRGKIMLKKLITKLLLHFIGKRFGKYSSSEKYYKPKKKKGLAYKFKKVFD